MTATPFSRSTFPGPTMLIPRMPAGDTPASVITSRMALITCRKQVNCFRGSEVPRHAGIPRLPCKDGRPLSVPPISTPRATSTPLPPQPKFFLGLLPNPLWGRQDPIRFEPEGAKGKRHDHRGGKAHREHQKRCPASTTWRRTLNTRHPPINTGGQRSIQGDQKGLQDVLAQASSNSGHRGGRDGAGTGQ